MTLDVTDAFADVKVVPCLKAFTVSCAKPDALVALPCCAAVVTDANADVLEATFL